MSDVDSNTATPTPGQTSDQSPRWVYYSLLLVVVATIVLYLPGIIGPFIHDDTGRITGNSGIQITELSVESLRRSVENMPSRPLPMASFALNYYQCGLESTCFKSTNIFIHVVTGLVLFIFLALLRRSGLNRQLFLMPTWLPLVVTAIWLLHPLNVSTVLYVVQRMTQLSLLFSLAFLICWLQARFIAQRPSARITWATAALLFLALGLASKENALLALPLAGLLELLMLPAAFRQRIARPLLTGWLLVALIFSAFALLALFPPRFIANSYLVRDFSPIERLLTEGRILWYYTSEILWPDASRMSFFLDFLPISRSAFAPWTTLPAALGWFLLCGISLAALLRRPSLWAFGILFFLINHLMESSLYGLILSYEHRNYGASIGLLLAGAALLHPLLRNTALRAVAFIILLAFIGFQLLTRVDTWSSEANMATHFQLPQFADSYNGTLEYAAFYDRQAQQVENPALARLYHQQAITGFQRAATLSDQPYAALGYLLIKARSSAEQDVYWQALLALARKQPANIDALNWTNVMASCLLVPQCPVSRARFGEYIDLLLTQPQMPTKLRNKFRRTAGTFFTRVMGEHEKGLALARQAAASGLPEAEESLIKNLAYAGRMQEARVEYEKFATTHTVDDMQRQRIEQALNAPEALPLQ